MSTTSAPTSLGEESPAPATAGAAVARNAFHLLLGQIASTALSIVLSATLGRKLGAEDFGLYFFLMSSTLFAYTVVEWGQSQFLIQEVARAPARAGALLGGALSMRIAGCALAAAIAGISLRLGGYPARTAWLAAAFIVAWLPTSLTLTYGLVFRGQERMDTDAMTTVASKALSVVAVVPALALGARLGGVIAALGLAGAGSFAVAASLARRLRLARPVVDRAELRSLLQGGFPLMVMNVVFLAQTYIETLLLSRLTPASVLGWYGAARSISGTLTMAGTILVTASFPRLSRAAADPQAFRQEAAVALRPALALAVLAMVGTYLFSDFAIGTIYGHEGYGPSVLLLQLLGPSLFLIFVDMTLGIVALAAGRAKRITSFKVFALVFAAVLGYPLIQLAQERLGNGAIGAIGAFVASELLMVGVFLSLIPRGVLDRRALLDLLRSLASGAASVLLVKALPWTATAITLPVCLLAFAGAARLTGLVRPAEVAAIVAAARRKLGR